MKTALSFGPMRAEMTRTYIQAPMTLRRSSTLVINVCADLATVMQTRLLKLEKPIKQSAESSKVRVQTVATG